MRPLVRLVVTPPATYVTRVLRHMLTRPPFTAHIDCECVDRIPEDALASADAPTPSARPTLYVIPFGQQVLGRLPRHYVVYQLEQLSASRFGRSRAYADCLFGALQCWEYTHGNDAHYTTHPVFVAARRAARNAPHATTFHRMPVPLLPAADSPFHPLPPEDEPRVDVLFYGTSNTRRRAILTGMHRMLLHHGYRMRCLCGTHDDALYAWIRRARVVLHLNYYRESSLASYRLNECLAHERVVVAERPSNAHDTESESLYADSGVTFVDTIDHTNIRDIYNKLFVPVRNLLRQRLLYTQHIRASRKFAEDHAATYRSELARLLASALAAF